MAENRLTGLRITHVAQPEHAGVPRVVMALARHQLRQGAEVTLISPQASVLSAPPAGARHVAWEATRSPGPGVVGETAALARALRRLDSDIVHLHSSKAGLAGRLVLRGRQPTVFQPHAWSFVAVDGAGAAAARRWERFATRWADTVVCVSDDERAYGERASLRARWSIVPNGVDTEAFAPVGDAGRRAARAALGLGDQPLAVLLGRASRQKGEDVMLRAWPHVRRLMPNARLALVGEGYEHAATAPAVLGVGRQEDVRPWLAAASVVVLPSRWEAGLSLAAMEAMATGRSVVLTDTWGARENVGGAGAVVPVGDADALADAVLRRLRDAEAADAEGRVGRVLIEALFDQRVLLADMDRVYTDILSRRAAR